MKSLLLLFLAVATAQIFPFEGPRPLWSKNIAPASHGNECAMYGNDDLLICTGSDGTTTALLPSTGSRVWKHTPEPLTEYEAFSTSGVAFGFNPTVGNYIIHAVSEGFSRVDPSYCVIYALNPADGSVLWNSQQLEGACSGTPVISEDGNYIFFTHNLVDTGFFTVLMAGLGGIPLYSRADPAQPYGPPGIFHNPAEGYYPGGSGNRNDIVIFAYTPKPTEIDVGTGGIFVFQFPVGFQGEPDNLAARPLNDVSWQSTTAPRLFNSGYSMMFAVSRSSFRVWNGNFGDQVNRFDKQATKRMEYERGEPTWEAVLASLELSSDPVAPMAFGGTASNAFIGFDSFMNQMWRVNTTFPIYAEARVSPDDKTVYFVERNGRVYAVDTETGVIRWEQSLGGISTLSDFAQSKSGKYLYFNNQAGILNAWQVADTPSPAPSVSPSGAPSSPTMPPSRDPNAPTAFPTFSPTVKFPTFVPSSAPSPVLPTMTGLPTMQTPLPTPNPTFFRSLNPFPTPFPTPDNSASLPTDVTAAIALGTLLLFALF